MIERLHNSMLASPVRWTLGLIVAVWLVLPVVAYQMFRDRPPTSRKEAAQRQELYQEKEVQQEEEVHHVRYSRGSEGILGIGQRSTSRAMQAR